MQKYLVVATTLFVVFFVSGCANSHRVSTHAKNQVVTEFYAWVEDVEEIRFQSNVGENAAIGAVDGFLSNSWGNRQDMLAGALIGGLFGGFVTAIFEGNTKGYEYQLAAIDGDIVSVIVEHKPADYGQCVQVRMAGNVRITLQPEAMCEEASEEYSQL